MIVTLFNRNYSIEYEAQNGAQNGAQNEAQNEDQNFKLDILKRRERIIELIKENKIITRSNLKDILGVSKATIKRDISKLREENKIEYIGSSKNGYWEIKNN